MRPLDEPVYANKTGMERVEEGPSWFGVHEAEAIRSRHAAELLNLLGDCRKRLMDASFAPAITRPPRDDGDRLPCHFMTGRPYYSAVGGPVAAEGSWNMIVSRS